MNEISRAPLQIDEVLQIAEHMHRTSLHRHYAFKTDIFENPAWLIALTLFIADRTAMAITEASLRGANMLSVEQSEIALAQMAQERMIVRGVDGPRLAPQTCTQIENYLKQIAAGPKSVF